MVARLLAMPSSAEDPQGIKNAMRWQLIRDIGTLGDVAIKPAQDALSRAKTADQRREMVQALGAMSTAASTRALLSSLAEDDEAINNEAMLKAWCEGSFRQVPWPKVRVVVGQGDWVVGHELAELVQWPGDLPPLDSVLNHSDLAKPENWENCSFMDDLRSALK